MNENETLLYKMMEYENDPSRIQHFMKVYEFARMIGQMEGLDRDTQFVLETASIVHDIGIKPAIELYGTDAGPYQEKEGMEPARKMLSELGYEPSVIERVVYLVGHHHTYTDVDSIDYQILLEADYCVNSLENHHDIEKIKNSVSRFFKTSGGIKVIRTMYRLGEE